MDDVTIARLHAALDYCVDFAKTMLERRGEFYPFGSAIDLKGNVVAKGAWTGEEHPDRHDLYKLLLAALRREVLAGEAIGIAVAADVNIPESYQAPRKDAIRVQLETHGFNRFVYFPYQIQRKGLFRRTNNVELFKHFSVELTPAL